MSRTASEQLARSSQADLHAAHHHRSVLLAAARVLSIADGHDHDVAPCDDARRRRTEVDPDGDVYAVARRLAALVDQPTPVVDIDVALPGFLAALAGSFEAIRTCRQTVHPVGHCWFTNVPGGDGCAEVLRLAHRLS